jgi:hypothetical protein
LAAALIVPFRGEAYWGARVGVVDERNLGYGLLFGMELPKNLGLDFGLTGFIEKSTTATDRLKSYWVQADVDLRYDFFGYFSERGIFDDPEIHPYVKIGGTYAGFVVDALTETKYRLNQGPGINGGGGVDWKVRDWITLGLDISESIVFLRGVTVSGVTSPASTAKVFSAMLSVKFMAY